jgi:arsenate reductase
MITLYHNPKCSKSRRAVELLRERGDAFETIEYLKSPPSSTTIAELVRLSGRPPAEFVRTGDADFVSSGVRIDATSTVEDVARTLAANPRWLQRPIARRGDRVVICRPPERCLDLVSEPQR